MATRIQRVVLNAAAWAPRPNPLRAVMRCSVYVIGDTTSLVSDLCHHVSHRLSWGLYGETVIPDDAVGLGVIPGAPAQHELGALVVSLDPNQPAPVYEDGSAKPSISEVRLILTQPFTRDFGALDTYIGRRREVCEMLSPLVGVVDSAPGPVAFMGAFNHAFSEAFDGGI